MTTGERKACLLLGPQQRQEAEAYLKGRGYQVEDHLSENTRFLLLEGALLPRLSHGDLDRCQVLGIPVFFLLDRNEALSGIAHGAAAYIFYKPLVLELVLRRIGMLLGEEPDEGGRGGWFTLQAQCSLDNLCVPRHLLAFQYFSDGVGILAQLQHPSRVKLMQQLYPALSQRHGSSPVMVDRAMRHGVESCWRLANKAVQRQYFGYSAQDKQGMPTNGEFLFALYEHVKLLLPYDRGRAAFLRELCRINGVDMGTDGCNLRGKLVY